MTEDPLQDLWSDTPEEEEAMTYDIAALRAEATHFHSTIRRRNLVESFAGGLVVASFGLMALFGGLPPLVATGAALCSVAGLFVVWMFVARGEGPDPVLHANTAEFVRAQREALEYQARLLDGVAWWYIAPFAPGVSLITIGAMLNTGGDARGLATVAALSILPAVVVTVWVLRSNAQAARDLREQADRLRE